MALLRTLSLIVIGAVAMLAAARAVAGTGTAPRGADDRCSLAGGSCAALACALAQQLGPTATGADVVIVELKSDRPLPSPTALQERVRSAVAGAVRGTNSEGRNGKTKLRLELSIESRMGTLRVSADLRRAAGFWQRVRKRRPRAERSGLVEAPLDAELRALIPPPPLVVSEVLKLKAPERGLVAVACGPLASGVDQELALVSRSSVRVGRVAGRTFVERTRVNWSTLSGVAPAPLREPIASAEITAQGTLRVGLTDRKDGLELSPDLKVVRRFEGRLPTPGGLCTSRSGLGLRAHFSDCTSDGPSQIRSGTLDALAGSQLANLGRVLESGRLTGSHPELSRGVARVGAQLALGDADGDGNPELAYSNDTLDAAKDRLTLVTLEGERFAPRFELSVPGIVAIAICGRRDGPGMAPIVVATGDELWVIR